MNSDANSATLHLHRLFATLGRNVTEMKSIETLEFYLKGSIEETFEGNSGKVYLVKNDCTTPKYSA